MSLDAKNRSVKGCALGCPLYGVIKIIDFRCRFIASSGSSGGGWEWRRRGMEDVWTTPDYASARDIAKQVGGLTIRLDPEAVN